MTVFTHSLVVQWALQSQTLWLISALNYERTTQNRCRYWVKIQTKEAEAFTRHISCIENMTFPWDDTNNSNLPLWDCLVQMEPLLYQHTHTFCWTLTGTQTLLFTDTTQLFTHTSRIRDTVKRTKKVHILDREGRWFERGCEEHHLHQMRKIFHCRFDLS